MNAVITAAAVEAACMAYMGADDDAVAGVVEMRAALEAALPHITNSEIARLRAELEMYQRNCDLLTHKVITCGVAASHPDAGLASRGAYKEKWDSPQAEEVRKLRAEADALRLDAERWRHARMLFTIDDIEGRSEDLRSFGYFASEEENIRADEAIDRAIAAMGADA